MTGATYLFFVAWVKKLGFCAADEARSQVEKLNGQTAFSASADKKPWVSFDREPKSQTFGAVFIQRPL